MSNPKPEDIKALRDLSGAGMMDCKKALIECSGDTEKAVEFLRKKGLAKASKRMDRQTGVGRVFSYIHGMGNIGVLLQLNCETDFVARNSEFEDLGKSLSMQIAATNPMAVKAEDISQNIVEKERAVLLAEISREGKKPDIAEKMLAGKIEKFYAEVCLERQEYIKDPKMKISDLIKQYISKFGENITVARYERFQVNS